MSQYTLNQVGLQLFTLAKHPPCLCCIEASTMLGGTGTVLRVTVAPHARAAKRNHSLHINATYHMRNTVDCFSQTKKELHDDGG